MAFGNRILFLGVIAWAIAQVLKTVIDLIVNRTLDWKRLSGSGGMPSSHSSFVVSVAVSIGMLYGFASPLFALGAALSLIVMYDACNVRRASGEQAKVLNHIIEHWNELTPDLIGVQLKELLGHTPLQVFFGALLGVAVSVIGNALIG